MIKIINIKFKKQENRQFINCCTTSFCKIWMGGYKHVNTHIHNMHIHVCTCVELYAINSAMAIFGW